MTKIRPFGSAVSAWFWFMDSRVNPRRNPISDNRRPCDPVDIRRIVERLHRDKLLTLAHIGVMNKYGSRGKSPDPSISAQAEDLELWHEAMDRLEVVLRREGIVREREFLR